MLIFIACWLQCGQTVSTIFVLTRESAYCGNLLKLCSLFCSLLFSHSGVSIPICRWRQMRHGQFFFFGGGGESIESLILSFNTQQYNVNFVHKFNNIFALYSLPIIFLKIFSLARLRFIPHIEMRSCMCFTNSISSLFFVLGGHYP